MKSSFIGIALLWVVALWVTPTVQDVYMHSPRGSNNKLNEQQNNRNNDRRLFDSQNNGNGGYQVGDRCTPNCLNANNQYDTNKAGAGQGVMEFYEGSELQIEWTHQHGCGLNPRLHCNVVLQYACEDHPFMTGLRDGITTNRIPTNQSLPNIMTFGQHENAMYYDRCRTRERNKGLFLADQNLDGVDFAIHTRQDSNRNADRYGFECPEEKDYYPYWAESPFRDIYVCSDETWRCNYYKSQSQNTMDRGRCSNNFYNHQAACESNGFEWTLGGAHNVPPPECGQCPTTRNNHLGQPQTGDSPSYVWKIPENIHADGTKCIVRLRYNISTYDFDQWTTDKLYNGANSPITTNPSRDFLNLGMNISGPLRLAINTDQNARTFQDRSHVFRIRKLPPTAKNWIGTNRIVNLNVRGRRGNIVQVYPSVEYDFVPNQLQVRRGDYLHIQWTGSDANAQGNDGQGKTGTDRSNLVLMAAVGRNYPMNLNPVDKSQIPIHFTTNMTLVAALAFQNQTGCDHTTQDTQSPSHCRLLNAAAAYQNFGLVKVENTGTFHLFSTRNNQFSNREQKAILTVQEDAATIASATAIAVGGTSFIGCAAFAGLLFFRRRRKNTSKLHPSGDILTREFDDMEENADPEAAAPEVTKKTLIERFAVLQKLYDWYQWEAPRIHFITFFVLLNVAAWIYGFVSNMGSHPAPFYPHAKGFGKMLDLDCSFILIPVLRNFLSFLRTTPVNGLLPLDDNLMIHKLTAWAIGLATVGHVSMHYMNYTFMQNFYGDTIVNQALATLAGLTGHMVLLLMLIMTLTAFLKRKIYHFFGRRFDGYHIFLTAHRLWIPVFALLWIHGPPFWSFSIWPLSFMAVERFIQARRARLNATIVEARLIGKDVLNIKMRLEGKKKFRYKAGQYLFLNCPQLSEREWHPFTITSAPEEPFFSCHIRCRADMDWTFALRQLLGFAERIDGEGKTIPARKEPIKGEEAQSLPALKVDGPFGSASEEVFEYNTVILVGAGIGVTPFASILKSISLRLKARASAADTESLVVYFYWICRDQSEFNSFKDLIDECMKNEGLKGLLEVNTYTTGELDLKAVKMESYNQFTGKPNWNRIMKEKSVKHAGDEVGVFLCGPDAIAMELQGACKRHTTKGDSTAKRTVFKFHKENF